jgi:hypothetical protein
MEWEIIVLSEIRQAQKDKYCMPYSHIESKIVEKRSGRDESIWVVIHMCMEAMVGISLFSCPYLN